ncbi:MAG: hypothetical protein C6Y20_01000 [Tagaea sp. CACIAM 22H2]|nr:hypothetical protein [Tagaea sp. CACIAM 22H2]
MKKEKFRLMTTFPGPGETPATGWVVCPAMAKLPAAQAEILVHLPVCDANGAAIAALDGAAKPHKNTHLALFAGDPFLHLPTVFRAAKRAGIEALATFPSAQLFDGETARAIATAGYGLGADLAFVRAAKAAGFATLALAADLAAAKALLAEGATRVALHPGPATPDKRANKAAAAAIDAACAALKGAPVLVHRAAGYDTALDAACAKARGIVLPLQPSMP